MVRCRSGGIDGDGGDAALVAALLACVVAATLVPRAVAHPLVRAWVERPTPAGPRLAALLRPLPPLGGFGRDGDGVEATPFVAAVPPPRAHKALRPKANRVYEGRMSGPRRPIPQRPR